MDRVDAATRSRVMASVRSKGNRSTERRLRAHLAASGLRGWRVQALDVHGKPDFVFHAARLAIFVDGCFWHMCPTCCRLPHTRRDYWVAKIEGNKRRDEAVSETLREAGWRVLRFWEHEVADDPAGVVLRIREALRETSMSPLDSARRP